MLGVGGGEGSFSNHEYRARLGSQLRRHYQHRRRLRAAFAQQGRRRLRSEANSHGARSGLHPRSWCAAMMNTRSLRFRITAWYAGLLAGTLVVFGASVYLGLERYLDWTLQRTLVAECRTIATELLCQLPAKGPAWRETGITKA